MGPRLEGKSAYTSEPARVLCRCQGVLIAEMGVVALTMPLSW